MNNNYSNTIRAGNELLKKINKTQAKKLYNEGKTINLIPCKCRPNGVWVHLCPISNTENVTFESMLNSYMYYNCIPELGLYPHYYVEL